MIMGTLDTQYFFILNPRQDFIDRDLFPSLTPDEDTAELPYSYERLPLGSKPLRFTNGGKDYVQRMGYTTIRRPPDILFSGSNPLARGDLREKFLALDIPNLELQPAIFIDDWNEWHEDYWFMTFTKEFDCWNRKTSDYEKAAGPIRIGGASLYSTKSINSDWTKKSWKGRRFRSVCYSKWEDHRTPLSWPTFRSPISLPETGMVRK